MGLGSTDNTSTIFKHYLYMLDGRSQSLQIKFILIKPLAYDETTQWKGKMHWLMPPTGWYVMLSLKVRS